MIQSDELKRYNCKRYWTKKQIEQICIHPSNCFHPLLTLDSLSLIQSLLQLLILGENLSSRWIKVFPFNVFEIIIVTRSNDVASGRISASEWISVEYSNCHVVNFSSRVGLIILLRSGGLRVGWRNSRQAGTICRAQDCLGKLVCALELSVDGRNKGDSWYSDVKAVLMQR